MMRATDETPSESRGTTGSKRLGMKMADRASVRRARRAAEWGKAKSFRAAVTRIRRAS